ncbi:ATP/GTP-binding protein [Paenibacillus xylanexedens]|uniref:AAA family ATPase n=1 Tax=Paenibacillus xylanexedens TaxID=528191 RepID=UPI0028E1ABBD|nr:ATP/GTP-binding protein [Paenibacillus xylanexedens]
MLVRFNVTNFLSFDSRQEFNMLPGEVQDKSHHLISGQSTNLLKFASIYGANASGKSNLIKALNFVKDVIRNGLSTKSRSKYFRLQEDRYLRESSFEYEINIGNKYYAYGFNAILNEGRFTGEWLYEISPAGDTIIFERDLRVKSYNYHLDFKSKEARTRFRIYLEDIDKNDKTLFLSEMNRNKDDLFERFDEFKVFKDIYHWFANTLDINSPEKPISSTEFFVKNDKNNNDHLFKLLDSLGTGITDFKTVDTSVEEFKSTIPRELFEKIEGDLSDGLVNFVHIRSQNNLRVISKVEDESIKVKTVYFSHGSEFDGGDFTLGEESDGTRRLLDLLEIVLDGDEKVYVIDEIDRSLHPNLTYKFIELFLTMLKNKKIQLIVTTHEDRMLDLNLLRRDEIWFVDKTKEGSSQLYSLESFETKFDQRLLNSYLEGRYGAIPKFKSIPSFINIKSNGGE